MNRPQHRVRKGKAWLRKELLFGLVEAEGGEMLKAFHLPDSTAILLCTLHFLTSGLNNVLS